MPDPRRFNTGQRMTLYDATDGQCARCGKRLEPGWHADHVKPFSKGGGTTLANGQALCPDCNIRKGARDHLKLRDWQRRHNAAYLQASPRDWLTSATPGAGKTICISVLARTLIDNGVIDRVIVAVPSSALKVQWAVAADRANLRLQPTENGHGREGSDFHGQTITYQQLIANPKHHQKITNSARTLVILDEIHHAGDGLEWGRAVREAFGQAHRRILITGTPFRTDNVAIPFAPYEADSNTLRPNFTYGYGDAVRDGVCRPIAIEAYDGRARWMHLNGQTEADLIDVDESETPKALETILQPTMEWLQTIVRTAHASLLTIRETIPEAAGMVIAKDEAHARGIHEMMKRVLGVEPVKITSEDERSDALIEKFGASSDPWVVSIRKISEGVDIPRLRVGVWATNYRTSLFFRQMVGRFVRVTGDDDLGAILYIPALSSLKQYGADVEKEIVHALLSQEDPKPPTPRDPNGPRITPPQIFEPIPISADNALLDERIYQGETFSRAEIIAAEEHCTSVGLPVKEAIKIAKLLRAIGSAPVVTISVPIEEAPEETPTHIRHRNLRSRVNDLVTRVVSTECREGDDPSKSFARWNTRVNQQLGIRNSKRTQASLAALLDVARWLEDYLEERTR